MELHPGLIAHVLSGLLIVTYAWGRFNTPASNRSSTRQALYWWSCLGYIVTALALFVCLSIVLQAGPWREALLGPADKASFPAPLIATLAMTTLMSSLPALQRLDAALLGCFHNWAAIPSEVMRRAEALLPEDLTVTEGDVAALRERYGDDTYGETLATHLRANRGEGLELSEYRFTRVVKLYDRVRRLSGDPRYGRFFAESSKELSALEKQVDGFLRRSDALLTRAARLRLVETPAVYEEIMHERREAFATSCRDIFRDLTLFLARAVLRSEATEADIVKRLQAIGFSAAQPMNRPEFPVDSLTLLGLGIFGYLALVSVVYSYLSPGESPQLLTSLKIALSRLAAVGVMLVLIQRHAFFQRSPGSTHRYFAYLVCGVIGSAASAVVFAPFLLATYVETGWPAVVAQLTYASVPVVISGIVCLVLAFCCNDWMAGEPPPRWLRAAEAGGCAVVVAVGLALMVRCGLFAGRGDPAWIIILPSVLTAIVAGYVPHIYRAAHNAAAARAAASAPASVPAQPGPGYPAMRERPDPGRSDASVRMVVATGS